MTVNRQPAGSPTGGQFAPGAHVETGTTLTSGDHTADPQTWMLESLYDDDIVGPFTSELAASAHLDEHGLDEDDYKLVDRTIEPAHKGDCDSCDAQVGVFDGRPVHLDDQGQPVLDVAAFDHNAYIDPRTYAGGDVDAVAEACGWGGTAWERYEDAAAERDVEDAYERGAEAATANLAGGVVLSGSAADVRARAQQAMWDIQAIYEIAGAKAAAEDILAEHPTAAVLELDWSYGDDGSIGWDGERILDGNGQHVADFVDFSDDHWASISDLPTQPKHRAVTSQDGTTRAEADTRYGFMTWDGNRRQGYKGKLDLKAAASVDLTTLAGAQ